MANQGRGQPPPQPVCATAVGNGSGHAGAPASPAMGGPRDPPAQTWREGGHTKEGLASPAEGAERFARVCRATRPPPARKLMCARGVTCESH